MRSLRRLMAFRLPETSPFPKLCHCQPAHPAANRYLKMTLSIAHSAVRQWTVHVAQKIRQNLRPVPSGTGLEPSQSHLPRCRNPLHYRRRSRQAHHQRLPCAEVPGQRQKWMKTILSESEIRRQRNPRFRPRRNRTRHVCIRSRVRCAKPSGLCRNLQSGKMFAASVKSA